MNAQAPLTVEEVQISFRASPETRKQARIAAAHAGISLNQWINKAVNQYLKTEQAK